MPDFRDVFEFTRKMLSGGSQCDDDKWQSVPFELRLHSRGDVPKIKSVVATNGINRFPPRPAATRFLATFEMTERSKRFDQDGIGPSGHLDPAPSTL
jgi:hypothetical protein